MKSLKKSVRAFGRLFGIDITSYHKRFDEHYLEGRHLKHLDIRTVIDVGANAGQFVREHILATKTVHHIHSFEPLPDTYKDLQKIAASRVGWETYCVALSDCQGKCAFHVSENYTSSSLLKVTSASTSVVAASRVVRDIEVAISRLDALWEDLEIEFNVLLKIDVQGNELNVLRGAEKMLNQVKAIRIEMSTIELYDGQPAYEEILSYLNRLGFRLFAIDSRWSDTNTGQTLQFDGVYVRC